MTFEINGFSMEKHGSGYIGTVHFYVPHDLAGMSVEEVAQTVLPKIMRGEFKNTRGDDGGSGDAGSSESPGETVADPPRRRGGRRAAAADEDAAAGEGEPAGGEKAGEVASDPTDAPSAGRGSRRRRGAGSTAATDEGARSRDPEPTRNVARRRRGGTSENPTKPAPAKGRRGKSTQTKSPSEKAVSDADMSRAASMAAEKHGPTGVMDKLTELGAKKVNDVAADKRQEFVDWAMGND